MAFKIGDKVKFLNDIGGGVINKIIDARTVVVLTEDDFEIPTIITELVKTEASGDVQLGRRMNDSSENEDNAPKKPSVKAPGIPSTQSKTAIKPEPAKVKPIFALVPDDDRNGFESYLLNDGQYDFLYVLSMEKSNGLHLIEKGSLEPGVKVSTGRFTYTELLKCKALRFQLLFFSDPQFQYCEPLEFEFPVVSANLKQERLYKENDYFYEDAFILDISTFSATLTEYGIDDRQIRKAIREKEKTAVKEAKPVLQQNTELLEVDLHIEEILDDHRGMSNGEILETQMARFRTVLDGAINDGKTKRVVFIHGIGNGRLKFDLRKELDSKYRKYSYQDASFAEYGFGATMVVLRG